MRRVVTIALLGIAAVALRHRVGSGRGSRHRRVNAAGRATSEPRAGQ